MLKTSSQILSAEQNLSQPSSHVHKRAMSFIKSKKLAPIDHLQEAEQKPTRTQIKLNTPKQLILELDPIGSTRNEFRHLHDKD